jgi:hypothetical protein
VWGMLAVSVLAMGVSTGPKALHVFAVYIGRNDNAEYKVSRDRYAIYFCDRQTDFRKEPSVIQDQYLQSLKSIFLETLKIWSR